jgi:hypothetical protein
MVLFQEEVMSVRNGIVLLLALSTLSFLAGCGSSNTPAPVAPPTGSFSNSNLNGTYVFSVSGSDVNGLPYAIVGTFIANGSGGNGKGGITGGTIDINDTSFAESSPVILPVANAPINGNGFYSVGVDGRGQATLGTSTPFGNITLDFVLTSNAHGLVTEFDGNGTGSGTLDLQTAGLTQASLAGPYAFSFSGVDASATAIFATVGAFTLDANGNISPGVEDFNNGGLAIPDQGLTGTVALGPSSTPATILTTQSFALTFDVYAIDATHLKFIEMDALPIVAGDAYSQPSAAISGTLAFAMAGEFESNPSAVGGFMVTDGAGNITNASTEDVNESGTFSSSIPFTASYSSTGSGRFVLNNFSGFFGAVTAGAGYAAYPSSGGLLLLEIDNGGLMTGAAYPQTPGATFAAPQGYGLNLSGDNLADSVEVDDIAEFTASGGNLTGLIDENFTAAGNTQFFGQALDGTYAGPDSSGRYTIAATTGSSSTAGTLNGILGLTFYATDGITFPFIESDSGQIAAGVFVEQTPSASSAAASHMFMVRPLIRPHSAARRQKK